VRFVRGEKLTERKIAIVPLGKRGKRRSAHFPKRKTRLKRIFCGKRKNLLFVREDIQ